MEIIFCLPVIIRDIFMAASTASDPEFHQKKESKEGWGIIGKSFSMR